MDRRCALINMAIILALFGVAIILKRKSWETGELQQLCFWRKARPILDQFFAARDAATEEAKDTIVMALITLTTAALVGTVWLIRRRRQQETEDSDLQTGDSHVVHMVHPGYHRYGARLGLTMPPWAGVLLTPYTEVCKRVQGAMEERRKRLAEKEVRLEATQKEVQEDDQEEDSEDDEDGFRGCRMSAPHTRLNYWADN